jgi:hypothetical protein
MPHKENFPYEAFAVIGKVLEANAHKHPQARWRKIEEEEHVNHAWLHLQRYLGEISEGWPVTIEDHLAHAFVRLALAVAVRESKKES